MPLYANYERRHRWPRDSGLLSAACSVRGARAFLINKSQRPTTPSLLNHHQRPCFNICCLHQFDDTCATTPPRPRMVVEPTYSISLEQHAQLALSVRHTLHPSHCDAVSLHTPILCCRPAPVLWYRRDKATSHPSPSDVVFDPHPLLLSVDAPVIDFVTLGPHFTHLGGKLGQKFPILGA